MGDIHPFNSPQFISSPNPNYAYHFFSVNESMAFWFLLNSAKIVYIHAQDFSKGRRKSRVPTTNDQRGVLPLVWWYLEWNSDKRLQGKNPFAKNPFALVDDICNGPRRSRPFRIHPTNDITRITQYARLGVEWAAWVQWFNNMRFCRWTWSCCCSYWLK